MPTTPARRHPVRRPVVRACLFATVLFALSCVLPPVAQPQAYHHFAAAVAAGPVEDLWNVLSNLAFVAVAAAGMLQLKRLERTEAAAGRSGQHRVAWTLAVSLALTGIGSAWYHAHPDDLSLVWDRLPMTLSFAAVVALALDRRDSLLPLAMFGVASVVYWSVSGNLTPYLALQGGAVLLLAVLACRPQRWFPALPVVAWYGLAKALEHFDAALAPLTDGLVAGHPLKHLAAAIAGWLVLKAYCRSARTTPAVHRPPTACPQVCPQEQRAVRRMLTAH
ncbi:hypothetical protein OOT46_30045 [Aquabacterium sp. A7-Y]|uniref:ceramidase domain-containing protein n=1 Tax=Aquabacterium sp. A7-Y TaxID=1349605 RepID=UPI00223CBC1F|nr:ceramidase domain-containing protein [Aquabacterium sp. A7-Y]MCW7542041.1 hypothetical protein [Aquabacterium sp. A7-Y]